MKTNKNNRRRFLKLSLTSAALASVAPAVGFARNSDNNPDKKDDNIIYRALGRTGIKVPVISAGAGDTNSDKLLNAALNSGIKLLATSQYYGNGNNEKLLGDKVLKGRSRDSYLIATSAMPDGFNFQEGNFNPDAKADGFIEKFEGSLARLGVDYVDIFFLPFPARRESVFFEPYLKAMEQIKQSGKARFIGVATHSLEHEAVKAAADVKIYDVIMTAYNFKKENIEQLNESINYAAGAGLGIIAMKTMAGAYWDKEQTLPINAKAALKWVLQNKNIHTVVPGITTFEQLEQNWSIMSDLHLSNDEMIDLKLAQNKSRHGIYCQQCGECLKDCPFEIDIPTAMRSYMYAFGYKNFKQAQLTMELANINELPCINCNGCSVNCPLGFNVKEKLTDIVRLKQIPNDFLA